jgi:LysM repeat protein
MNLQAAPSGPRASLVCKLLNGRRSARVLPGVIGALALVALLAAACGQVITLEPTPTPEPTATLAVAVEVATLPPTSTPAPYTPAPTATPTITPTPVIHTILSGESLLGVAGQYGVSVAALQDANGILDPRFLQVGQQLVIPRPEEVEEVTDANSTPTPTPLAVEVQNVYFNESNVGGLWVLGEVLNPGAESLEQVRVGVSLLDASNAEIARVEGLVALDLVDPGQDAPFAVTFGENPGAFDRYRVFATHAVAAYVGSYYRDLEVTDIQSQGERYASYTVTGKVRNTGPEDAVDVQVVLTAYDPLGRVIAMRKVTPEYNVIPRGGESAFTAVLAPVGGPAERFAAVAQGRRQEAPQP